MNVQQKNRLAIVVSAIILFVAVAVASQRHYLSRSMEDFFVLSSPVWLYWSIRWIWGVGLSNLVSLVRRCWTGLLHLFGLRLLRFRAMEKEKGLIIKSTDKRKRVGVGFLLFLLSGINWLLAKGEMHSTALGIGKSPGNADNISTLYALLSAGLFYLWLVFFKKTLSWWKKIIISIVLATIYKVGTLFTAVLLLGGSYEGITGYPLLVAMGAGGLLGLVFALIYLFVQSIWRTFGLRIS